MQLWKYSYVFECKGNIWEHVWLDQLSLLRICCDKDTEIILSHLILSVDVLSDHVGASALSDEGIAPRE